MKNILYIFRNDMRRISASVVAIVIILGLAAVLITSKGPARNILAAIAFAIAVCIWWFVFRHNKNIHLHHEQPAEAPAAEETEEKNEEN